jgi:orotate phosphoribosyltransferase
MRAARLAEAATAQKIPAVNCAQQHRRRWSRPPWAASSSATKSAARSASKRCSSNGPTGTFHLRRGFALERPAHKVLMVEDVVTTGLSSREAIKPIEARRRPRSSPNARTGLTGLAGSGRSRRAVLPAARAFNFPTYAPDELTARGFGARTEAVPSPAVEKQ